jgi:hypothetical protein
MNQAETERAIYATALHEPISAAYEWQLYHPSSASGEPGP